MAEYSSDSECSSDSESDVEIESVLKKIPKAKVPEVKAKRVYVKKPMTDEAKKILVDKLSKARAAKKALADSKKQADAQEAAEIVELKKLKSEGKLKVVKAKPAPVDIPKKQKKTRVVEVHNHYHNAPAEGADEPPKPPKAKKQPPAEPKVPKQPRIIFA